MSSFYSKLNYSFGNEDWQTEQKALKIKPDDRLLCITASGDRPLNLLCNPCKEIVAIDANPVQNHLLRLKIAAMQTLEYEEFLDFLGINPQVNRIHTLSKLPLKHDSMNYWHHNKNMIDKGILYQGTLEKMSKKVSTTVKFLRGKKIEKLFNFHDLESQKQFLETHWNSSFINKTVLRHCLNVALSPFMAKYILRDPGLYVSPDLKPGSYIYERLNTTLQRYLANESPLLSLLFYGQVKAKAFPPYLTAKGIEKIKPQLDQISIKTMNVISYLEECPDESFNCFSLSDIASYMSQQEFNRLMFAIYRTARPGARFSIRQFISTHKIPTLLNKAFIRDTALELELEKEDRCFVYRFLTGTITK